jgi:D-xylose 1-dehydrogenase (NADP+, D-xylono-1,5-lactone-forming)
VADKLRWGILSTAGINRALIDPLREATRSELLGIASRDAARADAYAATWNIPRAYGSYEALLGDNEIDAVYIPLPNSLHCDWVVKAAQAGKHLLCEKPLALSVAEVDTMTAAASQNGVVLIEAFMYRMHPQVARVQQIIAEGMIGKVKVIRAWFTFTMRDEHNIRLIKELGGGSLWDAGGYPVSFCQAVAGADPVEVIAWQRLNSSGVEVGTHAQLAYAGGAVAQIECGFDLPSRRGAEIVGDKGIMTVKDFVVPDAPGRGESSHIHLSVGDSETDIRPRPVNPFLCEVQVMERAALDGVPGPYTLAHSRGNIATMVALYRSGATRQPVRIAP